MPHMTEHAPKVSTRSVNPYARESSWKKLQQVRRTDRHTGGLTTATFLDVSIVTNPVLSFLHNANTSMGHRGKMGLYLKIFRTL